MTQTAIFLIKSDQDRKGMDYFFSWKSNNILMYKCTRKNEQRNALQFILTSANKRSKKKLG